MKNCLEDAGLTADEVDHINMHGTSTPLGDIAESNAISKLLGDTLMIFRSILQNQ
jgi:3-oxoacyl-[acyl-carrier-protein] synthase II